MSLLAWQLVSSISASACTVFTTLMSMCIYLTYSDQYPTRESGDKVACLDKVLLSFVGLQCGSML